MPESPLLDVVCLGCGCLCDDLRVTRGMQGWFAEGLDCDLGKRWLAGMPDSIDIDCLINSKPATREEALGAAAKLLGEAQRPLVCGLRGAATDAQRLAVGVAESLGGCVDWTTSGADASAALSLQTHGASAATLGEVAQRADLVVFLHCDPAATHPRHFERYSLTRSSPWLPGGRKDRTVVAIGDRGTTTAAEANIVLQATPGECLNDLQKLRAALAETELAEPAESRWSNLAALMKRSRYVALFHDCVLPQPSEAVLGQVTLLAQEAHPHTRMVTCCLGAGDNVHGAENVVTWQTGYPMAIDFSRGWPEYGPHEFTTKKLLERGEVDAALVVSSCGLSGLSDAALDALYGLPTVVLNDSDANDLSPTVELRVAPLGATPGGAVYRCDGVSLPLTNRFCDTPSHAEVLRDLASRLSPVTP